MHFCSKQAVLRGVIPVAVRKARQTGRRTLLYATRARVDRAYAYADKFRDGCGARAVAAIGTRGFRAPMSLAGLIDAGRAFAARLGASRAVPAGRLKPTAVSVLATV